MATKAKQSKKSLGLRNNVSQALKNSVRASTPIWQRTINQLNAHISGKRVVLTIENPNKEQTNKRYIKVLASTFWKDPKAARFIMQ
jgi:hypothetical protein